MRQDSETIRMMKEPPASVLEADFSEFTGSDVHLPAEVMYMLRSVRVFGHFEQPLFFELCKYIVTKSLPQVKSYMIYLTPFYFRPPLIFGPSNYRPPSPNSAPFIFGHLL